MASAWRTGMSSTLLAMAILALGVDIRLAHAHGVDIFAYTQGHAVHGQVRYAGRLPAKGLAVTIRNQAGKTLGTVTTDDAGQFLFEAKSRCDHYLTVDAGGGHGAEYLLEADEFPKDLAAPPSGEGDGNPGDAAVDLAALHHQVVDLRQEVHEYGRTVRVRDVLGGIGYIVGIAGIAFYFLGKRRASTK